MYKFHKIYQVNHHLLRKLLATWVRVFGPLQVHKPCALKLRGPSPRKLIRMYIYIIILNSQKTDISRKNHFFLVAKIELNPTVKTEIIRSDYFRMSYDFLSFKHLFQSVIDGSTISLSISIDSILSLFKVTRRIPHLHTIKLVSLFFNYYF